MNGHEGPPPKPYVIPEAKIYSVAEARNDLPSVIREVEGGRPAEITRRGKLVAVLLSAAEYQRLASPRPSFAEAYGAWRRSVDLEELDITSDHFDALRDRSPGRDVAL